MNCPHPSWIEIDLAQFQKNIRLIKKQIGSCLFCLPVKANAYGHGLCPMAKAALDAGVDYLGVSCLQEGALLRNSGIAAPILVFGAIHEDQIPDLIRYDLEFTISSPYKADLVAAHSPPKPARIHLKVDTGMQRTGMRPDTALALFEKLQHNPSFDIRGIYSHLATSDHPSDPTALAQIDLFHSLTQHPTLYSKKLLYHLANSGGVAHYPSSLHDMARPGILAYGYLPPHAPASLRAIRPCFSLKAKISYFKVVGPNQGISYGHAYKTSGQTRIVTIPIGYGDGYRRALSNKGHVLIRGKRYPISGTICMDQFMVDIGQDEAYVGDEVTLIGKEIPLEEIADLCDTITYEILCGFNDRIPRVYKN